MGSLFGALTNLLSSDIDMRNFTSFNWSGLSNASKKGLLQKIENQEAASQGRAPRRIVIDPNRNARSGCYSSDGKGGGNLIISGKDFDSNNGYECLDSVYHEGRHGYVDDVIHNRIPNNETEATKRLWSHDDLNGTYIKNGEGPYSDYYFQSQERETYSFAKKKMDENEQFFADDPEYQKYVKHREHNRELALEDAKANYGVNTEEEAAQIADKKVEERYQKIYGTDEDEDEEEEEEEIEEEVEVVEKVEVKKNTEVKVTEEVQVTENEEGTEVTTEVTEEVETEETYDYGYYM